MNKINFVLGTAKLKDFLTNIILRNLILIKQNINVVKW